MNKAIYTLAIVLTANLFSCKNSHETPSETALEKGSTTVTYQEQHRPQFHHSPPFGWANDPNGMVYFDGEYHLFYQHYPDSTVWGPMHWGHAVSKDLVNWENLPIALFPDSLGYIFSGSAVVDTKNTSGMGQNGQPPLVAIFTYHDEVAAKAGSNSFQHQAIAYSNDRGRTWVKYDGNPVLPNPGGVRDIRDPKVIWHESLSQWIMALAVGDHIEFWGAPNLKRWTKLSDFGKNYGSHGSVWECPDLFPIKVEGSGETKWLLIVNLNPGGPNGGSAGQYFVGEFDGKNFKLDDQFAQKVPLNTGAWLDWGKDNYAAVTWSDAPSDRRLLLGWMSNWEYANQVPAGIWRNAMTLPRSLSLRKTAGGYHLFAEPVQELQTLRTNSVELQKTELTGPLNLSAQLGFPITLSEMELEFELKDGATGRFCVEISNIKGEVYRIGYDTNSNQLFSDRTKSGDLSFSEKFAPKPSIAPRYAKDKKLTLHLFFDAASVELFADGGSAVMTELFFPTEDFTQAKLFAEGGKVTLISGKVHQLKGIWH